MCYKEGDSQRERKELATKPKITHATGLSFRLYYTIQESRKSHDGLPYVNTLLLSCANIVTLNLFDLHFDYFFFFFFFFLNCRNMWHMEVPGLGIKWELQLQASSTATPDSSHICNLCCSLRQHQILTHSVRPEIEPTASWTLCHILKPLNHNRTSLINFILIIILNFSPSLEM